MKYLLDTNIVSDLIRNPNGVLAARIHAVGDSQICTSVIVAAEIRYGVAKRASVRLAEQAEKVLAVIEVLPLSVPMDRTYGLIRAQLENAGRLIGGNDLLIAAQALALGHTLVTDNEREFARVKGLLVENWLQQR